MKLFLVIFATVMTRVATIQPISFERPSVRTLSLDHIVPIFLKPSEWETPAWLTHFRFPWKRRQSSLNSVTSAFESVGPDIKSERLIRACELFLVIQRKMGPPMRVVADHFEANIKMAREAYEIDPVARATLKSFLEDELRCGLHDPSANKLSYPSGACALLWMRRSIAFHTVMFEALVEDADALAASAAAPSTLKTSPGTESSSVLSDPRAPSKAALIAYHRSLEKYHGYMLQTAYRVGLSRSMPSSGPFLAKFSSKQGGGGGLGQRKREAEVALAQAAAAAAQEVSAALLKAAAEAEALAAEVPSTMEEAVAHFGGSSSSSSSSSSTSTSVSSSSSSSSSSDGSGSTTTARSSSVSSSVSDLHDAAARAAKAASHAAARAAELSAKATEQANEAARAQEADVAREEAAALRDMRALVKVWRPTVAKWEGAFEDLSLEDYRKV